MIPINNISKNYYYIALMATLLFNGATFFFTFQQTYDSYVHIFFANHYAQAWFDNWEYRWYTGFNITSYPPLVHQMVALLSWVLGLKLAFYAWAVFVQLVFVRGVYYFSKILVDESSAGIAAILAVFSSSMIEALHIFGQVPSITGLSFLLNACPEIYNWFRYGNKRHLIMGLLFLSVTTAAHHVTTIFGMVFFVLPIIGLAVIDNSYEQENETIKLKFVTFFKNVIKVLPKGIAFGAMVIGICITVVFPYWYWSKTDPINQVSIPHGSRDSFILQTDMGLIFFLIPWGVLLLFLSYFFTRATQTRYVFIGLSLVLLFILGTGGTTPIPKILLGENAFNILTLDRFTFWGTMLSLPFFGLLVNELLTGSLKVFLLKIGGNFIHKFLIGLLALSLIGGSIFIINMNTFNPFQPKHIDIEPIVQFLEQDQHSQWRYLALGFGDQMAWLSANTNALTVDGNYHSARRLPELTTRAIERLENAKFKGEQGLSALRDFLVNSDKFHLKFIFNNDKFYEPILSFTGWHKTQVLDNNIAIWEKPDIAPLPSILPRKNIPQIQRLMWGILPLFCFFSMGLFFLMFKILGLFYKKNEKQKHQTIAIPILTASVHNQTNWYIHGAYTFLALIGFSIFISLQFRSALKQDTPQKTILSYFNALDFRYFEEAHEYINTAQNIDFEQFVMEQSIEGGILASYAKLSDIESEIISENENKATAQTTANWITSLGEYTTKHEFELEKIGKKWFLNLEKKSIDIPPDQFVSLPELGLHNQGRRLADIHKTRHEDVLDRPMVNVLEANLVKNNNNFSVVGYVQNLDNVPAYIAAQARVYDINNVLLGENNVCDIIKHAIYPKEITPFRIDLPYIDQSNCIENFVLGIKSLVNAQPNYQHMGLQNLAVESHEIEGEFVNFGTQNITVPQVIMAQRNENNTLFWVEKNYLESGIRPQRKANFTMPKIPQQAVEIVAQGKRKQFTINGKVLPQTLMLNTHLQQEIAVFANGFITKNE